MTCDASEDGGGSTIVLVDRRVDWFEVRARVALRRGRRVGDPDTLASLRRAAKEALAKGVAPVRLGDLVFGEMRAPSRPLHYVIRNASYTLEVDASARELAPTGELVTGWNVRLEWRATELAERGFDPHLTRAIFAELGAVIGVRLARFDMAATFAGWAIRDRDRKGLVVRSRASVERYYHGRAERDLRPEKNMPGGPPPSGKRLVATLDVAAHGAQRATGWTVGAGGDVQCRTYDKLAELCARGHLRKDPETGAYLARTRKGEIELALWTERGVDPKEAPITRVEFQIRGAALDEFGVRDPDKLREQLGPIWRYLVGVTPRPANANKGAARDKGAPGWVRLVAPTSASRRKRAKLDPRWSAVRAVVWDGAGSVAQRIRRQPRGASYRQALGAMLGAIAEAGCLPRLAFFAAQGRGLTMDERVATIGQTQAVLTLSQEIERACKQLAALARDTLIAEKGAHGALAWWCNKHEATRERFARIALEKWQAAEIERRDRIVNGPHPQAVIGAAPTAEIGRAWLATCRSGGGLPPAFWRVAKAYGLRPTG